MYIIGGPKVKNITSSSINNIERIKPKYANNFPFRLSLFISDKLVNEVIKPAIGKKRIETEDNTTKIKKITAHIGVLGFFPEAINIIIPKT